MKSSTKLFLFMSFVACTGSDLLKAGQGGDLDLQQIKILRELSPEKYKKYVKQINEREYKRHLFDAHKDLHQQNVLLQKLVIFLKKEGRDPEFIEKIYLSGGICFALAFLWGYGKRLQDEPIMDPIKERDDYDFFNKTYRLLVTWNGELEFTESQKRDIDRLLSNIILYQGDAGMIFEDIGTQEVQSLFEDTKGKKIMLVCEKKWEALFHEMLLYRLKALIAPKTIILISFCRHAVSFYQQEVGGSIEYYDSNNGEGEKVVDSVEKLVIEIWKSFLKIRKQTSSQLFWVQVYQLEGGPVYDCPSKEKLESNVLKELVFFLNTIPFSFVHFERNKELERLMDLYPNASIELLGSDDVDYALRKLVMMAAFYAPQLSLSIIKIRKYIEENYQDMMEEIILPEKDMQPTVKDLNTLFSDLVISQDKAKSDLYEYLGTIMAKYPDTVIQVLAKKDIWKPIVILVTTIVLKSSVDSPGLRKMRNYLEEYHQDVIKKVQERKSL